MANIGVIAEFNPFHRGHELLLSAAKHSDSDTVTCVMSGNFVQRGDTAIFSKSERTAAALSAGADLVLELPTPWAMAGAERFADGSVAILGATGIIDALAFGCECGSSELLLSTIKALSSAEFNENLKAELSKGLTFAAARTEAVKKINPKAAEIISSPNNILAIEYMSAAARQGFNPDIRAVSRSGAPHDSDTPNEFASASYIRQKIKSGNINAIADYVTSKTLSTAKSGIYSDINRLETAILYSLRCNNSPERYAALPDISEGLENKIAEAVNTSATLDELIRGIKSKRYTLARIRRIILSAFLNLTDFERGTAPPYIRVLGFNDKGRLLLKEISRTATLPIITTAAQGKSLSGFAAEIFALECRATDIWSLSLNSPQRCGNEYFHKLVKGD